MEVVTNTVTLSINWCFADNRIKKFGDYKRSGTKLAKYLVRTLFTPDIEKPIQYLVQ
jgi:hypothetical protein